MSGVTKTFAVDIEETAKELRYSLSSAGITFDVKEDAVVATFTDVFEFQAWAHAYKQWFDKSPVEIDSEACGHD